MALFQSKAKKVPEQSGLCYDEAEDEGFVCIFPYRAKLRFRPVKPGRATVHWTVANLFFESLLSSAKKMDTRLGVHFFGRG